MSKVNVVNPYEHKLKQLARNRRKETYRKNKSRIKRVINGEYNSFFGYTLRKDNQIVRDTANIDMIYDTQLVKISKSAKYWKNQANRKIRNLSIDDEINPKNNYKKFYDVSWTVI